jgi:acetyl-CoA carboxylase carboxyl transferase subunit beta
MHIKLPDGAVTSEFALQHGMIDAIVHRRELRHTLAKLLHFYADREPSEHSTITMATTTQTAQAPTQIEQDGR